MNCEYFGKCGSCSLHDKNYEEQLDFKLKREKERFSEFFDGNFDVIKSSESAFRNRAEFRIWKDFDEFDNPIFSYAMNGFDKNVVPIKSCQIVSSHIQEVMPQILEFLQNNLDFAQKIFAIEFLGSTTKDLLVTLIYHKKLDENWIEKGKLLQEQLNIKIMGRSRGQRLVLSEDNINETLPINGKDFSFNYQEGGFTQPNTNVNSQMISWVLNNINESPNDLCELYCGGGNFTIPLSTKFKRVLATEISKTSIKSAKNNCSLNDIKNIEFIRMSAEEFSQALNEVRAFNRLKDIDLKDYCFDTIFVDPPRAGLDDLTTNLVKNFGKIIYISCNPETLHRDLKELSKSHNIQNMALFDQFAYTHHIECGVILNKI